MLPPLLQTASLRKIRSTVFQNLRASAARSAAGRPGRKISGSASAVIHGIRLTLAASASLPAPVDGNSMPLVQSMVAAFGVICVMAEMKEHAQD
jgi:hypothetical protein